MQSKWVVGIARGLALFLAVLAAYSAQHVLLSTSLSDLLPPRMIKAFPSLGSYLRWRQETLNPIALWAFLIAAVVFGLITPIWRSERWSAQPSDRLPRVEHSGRRAWLYPLGAAGFFSALVAVMRGLHAQQALGVLLWAVAVSLYLWSGVRLGRRIHPHRNDPWSLSSFGRLARGPADDWPMLFGILAIGAAAYLARWLGAPTRIDLLTAEVGLFSQAGSDAIAGLSVSYLPELALSVPVVWTRLTGDSLVGTRIAGLFSGLLLATTVWLLAAELFRRAPSDSKNALSPKQELRLGKTVATAIAAFGLPVLFFARSPILLESVAWGSLGVWALLFGLRTGLVPIIGFGAVFLGVGSLYGPAGLILSGICLAVWAGVFALNPEWPDLSARATDRLRQPEWVYWLAGLGIVLLPLIGGFLGPTADAAAYFAFNSFMDGARGSLGGAQPPTSLGLAALDTQAALLSPVVPIGVAGPFGFDAPMLSAVIAPLYILGLGALVTNLDTMTGWVLACWIVLGTVFAVLSTQPFAAHWASLLVVWPAISLATAFAVGRMIAAISDGTGAWTRQATLYLASGLVAAAAILSWLNFYERAMLVTEMPSTVGRAVRRALHDGDMPRVLVSEPWTDEELIVLAFLAGSSVGQAEDLLLRMSDLPAELPPQTRLIVAAEEWELIEPVRARYPDADLAIHRVLHGNPVTYTFSPPGTVR